MESIKKLGTRKNKSGNYVYYGLFLCPFCLQEVEKSLSNGKIQESCGCHKNYKDGRTGTKLYTVYQGMKKRCLNPNHKSYKDYGGRGITICEEWLDKETGYIKFRDYALSTGYEEGLTIDRIDNDGNYEPKNCRWVTNLENMRNRGWNKIKNMEKANEIRTLYDTGNYTQKQLAKLYGVSQGRISAIINNKSWKT